VKGPQRAGIVGPKAIRRSGEKAGEVKNRQNKYRFQNQGRKGKRGIGALFKRSNGMGGKRLISFEKLGGKNQKNAKKKLTARIRYF